MLVGSRPTSQFALMRCHLCSFVGSCLVSAVSRHVGSTQKEPSTTTPFPSPPLPSSRLPSPLPPQPTPTHSHSHTTRPPPPPGSDRFALSFLLCDPALRGDNGVDGTTLRDPLKNSLARTKKEEEGSRRGGRKRRSVTSRRLARAGRRAARLRRGEGGSGRARRQARAARHHGWYFLGCRRLLNGSDKFQQSWICKPCRKPPVFRRCTFSTRLLMSPLLCNDRFQLVQTVQSEMVDVPKNCSDKFQQLKA